MLTVKTAQRREHILDTNLGGKKSKKKKKPVLNNFTIDAGENKFRVKAAAFQSVFRVVQNINRYCEVEEKEMSPSPHDHHGCIN